LKNIAIFFLALVFMCTGCVKQEDLLRVEEGLGIKIAALQKDTSALMDSIKSTRKRQANVDADSIDLRKSVQSLRGATEKLTVSVVESKEQLIDLHTGLKDISSRLTYIEKSMGITDIAKSQGSTEKGKNEGAVPDPAKKGISADKEKSYSSAYSKFKEGKYGAAKEAFRKFLKSFPDTEYSDNAQFWIGECEYFEGRYEEAIVEYEGVIRDFPKGNKVPNAFLKQAYSFLNLGDKASAKLLLRRVINDYPSTTPATVARKKLIDIK